MFYKNTESIDDQSLDGFLFFFSHPTDQQADRVLPAAGPQREAGERPEEVGQETTVHAIGILGTLLPLSPVQPFQECHHTVFFNLFKCQAAVVSL